MKKDHTTAKAKSINTTAKTKSVKGSIKEAIGKISGDKKLELRGSIEKSDGEKQIINEIKKGER